MSFRRHMEQVAVRTLGEFPRWLHSSGRIAAALGRPLPIVLYDMFDPDEMFALTAAANPAELVADFLAAGPEGRT